MKALHLFSSVGLAALAGCTTNSGVVPIGNGNYEVTGSSATALASDNSHWVQIAQSDDSEPGFRSVTTWDIDSSSPKNEGHSGVSVLLRATTNQDSTIPLGDTTIVMERFFFDCVAQTYFVEEGTSTSLDHGKVTVFLSIPRSTWIVASPQNRRANRLLNAVCGYINPASAVSPIN